MIVFGCRASRVCPERPLWPLRIRVKLSRERVAELVEQGVGEPFAPAGKVFGEWVAIPTVDRDLWQQVLAEAVDFAREGLAG